MESTVAVVQPMGHANHMPSAEFVQPDKRKARVTRKIRSVKVATMNCRIALAPRRMPSATNLVDIAK